MLEQVISHTDLEKVGEAYAERDVTRYREKVKALIEKAQSMSPMMLIVGLRNIECFASEASYAGLQPLINGYLKRMISVCGDVSPQRLKEIELFKEVVYEESLLSTPRLRGGCAEFWQQWARTDLHNPPPDEGIGLISCMEDESQYETFNLADPLTLPEVETCSEFTYILSPPTNISPGFSVEMIPDFYGDIVWNTDGSRIAIYTQPFFRVAMSARTKTFIIRIQAGGSNTDFHITLPVRFGIHTSCETHQDHTHWIVSAGQAVDIRCYSSGPQGTMILTWEPISGSSLPDGLYFQPEVDINGLPTGCARITGTVAVDAHSGYGRLRLQNGNNIVERDASIKVRVHLSPADIISLSKIQELQRGQTVSFQLPTLLGGDGNSANYGWKIKAGSILPPGLTLKTHNNNWFIEGSVSVNAPVKTYLVDLIIYSSPNEVSAEVTISFNISIPLRVWTQNTFLMPYDYIPTWAQVAACLWPLSPSCVALVGAEAIWDLACIQNTEDDNEERARHLLDHLFNAQAAQSTYDIVALQEVFEPPFASGNLEQIVNGAQEMDYSAFIGPSVSGIDISSGLVLLVYNRLQVSLHFDNQVFTQGANEDALAQKGFTLSKVSFSDDPNDYIYVVNTHLQANSERSIREHQLQQLSDFVDRHTEASHPVLILGDFNIIAQSQSIPSNSEYASMLRLLGNPEDIFADMNIYTDDTYTNAYAHYWGNPNANSRARLDYILIRQGFTYRLVVDDRMLENKVHTTMQCHHQWHVGTGGPLTCYLSDHYGLSVKLRLTKF